MKKGNHTNAKNHVFSVAFKRALLLIISISLFTFHFSSTAHATKNSNKCSPLFSQNVTSLSEKWSNRFRSIRATPGKVTEAAKKSWDQFRVEIKEQGKIRYLLAPRDNPKKFSFFLSFMDPLIDFPVELSSFVKHRVFKYTPVKRRASLLLSIPLGMFLWGGTFMYLDHQAHVNSVEALQRGITQDRAGAIYISTWVSSGKISPTEGVNILVEHENQVASVLSNLTSLEELPRIQQFKELKILTPSDTSAFINIARDALGTQQVSVNFNDTKVRNGIQRRIDKSADFEHLNENQRFLLSYVFWPTVIVEDKPEIYWYDLILNQSNWDQLSPRQVNGIKAIKKLAEKHGDKLRLPDVVELIADTVERRSDIDDKILKARKLNFPEQFELFASRADLPIFSGELEFKDMSGSRILVDELDRWNLVFNDRRFKSIRSAWESGEISDFVALIEVTIHIKSLSQIYETYLRENHATPNSASEVANISWRGATNLTKGNESTPANPILGKIEQVIEKIEKENPKGDVEQLRYTLANIYFRYFVQDAIVNSQDVRQTLYIEARRLEEKAIRGFLSNAQL